VRGLQEDRRLSRSRMAVQTGGIQAAISYLGANETPQLMIVEAKETGEALFERIEALAEVCNPNSHVVLIGAENDIALYRQLKGLGLAEYFSGDVATDQLMSTIETIFTEDAESALGRVISFMGARGGVGSSVIAANTASRLGQETKDDVLLIDCDLSFGTAALTCNVEPKQTLADALAQPARLDETLVERVKLGIDDYLSLVPAPATLSGDYEIQVDAFEKLVQMGRGLASYVVLDIPHQWSPWVQDVLVDSSQVVLTTTPDLAGMRDTQHIKTSVARSGEAEAGFHLVFNKVGMSRKTEITAKDFETQIGVGPRITIPWDPVLFGTALNNGELLSKTGKSGKVLAEIDRLARIVSGVEPLTKKQAKAKVRTHKKSGISALRFAR
jgi:pilus assembly protein CpaE